MAYRTSGGYRSPYSSFYSLYASLQNGSPSPLRFGPRLGFAPGGSVDSIPLGAAFWSTGGYWDFRKTPGVDGAPLTSGLSSLANTAILSPSASPLIEDGLIGGNRAIEFDQTLPQYLIGNALSSLIGGLNASFSVAIRFRSEAVIGTFQTLFAAGNSAGAGTNFFKVYQDGGGRLVVAKSAAGGVVRTGNTNLDYNEHILILSVSGNSFIAYLDGAVQTFDSNDLTVASVALDRFALAANLANSATLGFGGAIQAFGITSNVITPSQASIITLNWQSTDFILQKSNSDQLGWFGDSITVGSLAANFTGFRAQVMNYILDNRLSVNAIGTQPPQGQMANSENSAQSGAQLAQILALAALDIGTGTRNRIKLAYFNGGINNLNAGAQSSATVLATYTSTLNSFHALMVAQQPNYRPVVSNLTSIQAGNTGDTQYAAVNAGLPTIWNAFDAAHPANATIRVDVNADLGGAWNATNYGDLFHPNTAGHALIGADLVSKMAVQLRAISPTLAPLAVSYSPLNPSNLNALSGFAQAFRTTRSNLNFLFLVDGMPRVGVSIVSNRLSAVARWIPTVGDVGVHTVQLQATDPLDGSTAVSPAVSVTVSAAETPVNIFGAALIQWNNTDVSATGILWADSSANGKDYAGTWTLNAVDATLNNKRTATMNGTTDVMACATLTFPTPTAGTPVTVLGACKLNAAIAAAAPIDVSSDGAYRQSVAGRGGAIVGSQSGVLGGSAAYTVNQWVRYMSEYSNQATDRFIWGSQSQVANSGPSVGTTGRSIGGIAAAKSNMTWFDHVVVTTSLITPSQLARYDAFLYGRSNGAIQL